MAHEDGEEEDWPITKLAASRRSSRLRRTKTVSKAKLKLDKDKAASKEKENWSKFSRQEPDTRTFQRSLARRVPMPDLESANNVLEPAAERLNEAEGIGLERDSNLVSPKKRKRTFKSLDVQPLAEAAIRLA